MYVCMYAVVVAAAAAAAAVIIVIVLCYWEVSCGVRGTGRLFYSNGTAVVLIGRFRKSRTNKKKEKKQ